MAWLATCAFAANSVSVAAWFTCFGAATLGNGLFNLMPFPLLNGHAILLTAIEMTLGRVSDGVQAKINIAGFVIGLITLALILYLDVAWLIKRLL